MKSSLLLLAGFAALSLSSCSSNSTTETATTTTPADSTGATATTTTTRTYTDADYRSRGDRMATRFASQNKISDAATLAKLKTAYYNRAKRYDEMIAKFKADTAGMATAKRDYMKANDQEFQTILLVPAQYQAYQSSQNDYDEANNLDTTDQTAAASSATMPSADSTSSSMSTSSSSNMNSGTSGSGTPTTAGKVMRANGMLGPDNTVEKSKTKLENGAKVKVKDGDVKVKTADGEKMKM
ncbi:hypothetical protein HHL22_22765 [Hymenobacter sp. RP-2-7]|uniref:Lipoprotein n=1 Tax=Hymenobacter polaris TaxID=2682546 RepID=A0A7Y0AJ31_9BACT|nr:hypothetical protein [Hymenobacter polaris]NML68030.1 hypothetical protein [Hymenobacter polaris]